MKRGFDMFNIDIKLTKPLTFKTEGKSPDIKSVKDATNEILKNP